MRSFRIRLNLLTARLPQVRAMRQAGQIRLTVEATDVGCERLAAETSFARLLIVDKSNARLPRQLALIPRQSCLGRRGTFN